MRISNQCSMALHTLVLLEIMKDKKLTSERIARSVGCNPVMIRTLLGKLKEAGLVDIHRGTGGAVLRKEPKDITVWDVYHAVDPDSIKHFIGKHSHPYSQCSVGQQIENILEIPYEKVRKAVRQAMAETTLEDMVEACRRGMELEPEKE